jgi:hypothetical protein
LQGFVIGMAMEQLRPDGRLLTFQHGYEQLRIILTADHGLLSYRRGHASSLVTVGLQDF